MYEIKGSYRNVIKFDDDFFEKEKKVVLMKKK